MLLEIRLGERVLFRRGLGLFGDVRNEKKRFSDTMFGALFRLSFSAEVRTGSGLGKKPQARLQKVVHFCASYDVFLSI